MSEFTSIVPALAEALQQREYKSLTPVQQAVIDEELVDADLLVSAQTGSGKTVAFGLAMAPTLLADRDTFKKGGKPQALAIAPTRELALQVKRELEWLYAKTGAVITSCVGGMDIRTERRALERGADIVVGTPGRLRDHISKRALDTRELKAVILDEADEMLDLGFREDLEFILDETPEDRRTLLFSATVPPMIAKLAQKYQNDPVRIQTAEEKEQHVDIEYRVLVTAPRERENAIINVLRFYEAKNALVFCNTRAAVNHMVARFNNRGFSVVALSGELTQSERTNALQSLRDGRARVCIATDVAARGIDLPNLELVIHADLPSNPETLLHRSGRTGRAGRKGVSALMVDVKGKGRAERLLRFAKLNAEWAAPPSADDVNLRDQERLLADPMFSDAIEADEQDAVEHMMDSFTPTQIAAALVRLNRQSHSAPEDIQQIDVHAPAKRKFEERGERSERKPREEFENSVWISLSVGRKHNAEPRWLIPVLCKSGDISKRDIGMIKMQPQETFVQLNAEMADVFFDGIGPNQTLEKNVRVKRLEGKPKFHDKPFAKKPHRKGGGDFADRPKGKKFGGKKTDVKKKWDDKPKKNFGDASKPVADKPKGKKPAPKEGWATKKKGKPDFKGKRNSAGGKPAGKKPFKKSGGKKPVSKD